MPEAGWGCYCALTMLLSKNGYLGIFPQETGREGTPFPERLWIIRHQSTPTWVALILKFSPFLYKTFKDSLEAGMDSRETISQVNGIASRVILTLLFSIAQGVVVVFLIKSIFL